MKRLHSPLWIILTLFAGAALCLSSAGCASLSGPPSALEASLFNVETNHVQEVQAATNTVPVVLPVTTAAGETVLVTNYVERVVYVTNSVPVYTFSPGDRVEAVRDSATQIGNLVAPGSGTLIGLVVGGVASIWASIRSARSRKLAAGMAQAIETARKVLQTTPQGQAADKAFVQWLKRHQTEQGVMVEVLKLIQKTVDDKDAERVAGEISRLIAERA